MSPHYLRAGLLAHPALAAFIETEALPGLDLSPDDFWAGLAGMVAEFGPRTRDLLAERGRLQHEIDEWHKLHGPVANDPVGYEAHLRHIGYVVHEPDPFHIETQGLDPEISRLCGPQLVVPVSNARYALNAANARWGSLYDALYGTDAIPRSGALAPGAHYNPQRGAAVFGFAADLLDAHAPLAGARHGSATGYRLEQAGGRWRLVVDTPAGPAALADPTQYVGHSAAGERLTILLAHHGLHFELIIDRSHPIGRDHPAGLADIMIESALTTIQDCEDSVAAVDAEDKVAVYRNWLGLMTGSLCDRFQKRGQLVERQLEPDRTYTGADGAALILKGRALLLVRNVGHLMTSDAIVGPDGEPIGEGLLDAAVTALCALHDRASGRNSATGAIYVVKPKMHGPAEVQLACDQFAAVEAMLGLPADTIKIGIMDEERRTSANLTACIHAARQRLFFINTGFLDRTGDEIHTAMQAGPVLRKDDIKAASWLAAYEDRNVLIGLACGLAGRAQIGKGMWPKPDEMAAMLASKRAHPAAGANCAWVPSPTAATLHALHYHEVDVFAAQQARHDQPTPPLSALFAMPALSRASLSPDAIRHELDTNAQGILGYVVRWVEQGIGCSKVPDLAGVGLMEDRATLRISSQHLANWLLHGVITQGQVQESFRRMAALVDAQNAGDPHYLAMAPDPEGSIAFETAIRLVLEGVIQPSGYTEPLLHGLRRRAKLTS